MDVQEEIHQRLAGIRNALSQAEQASGVMRAVPEPLRQCLRELSDRARDTCARYLRPGNEDAVRSALDHLQALAEQACELSGCGQGDAHRLRSSLEETRQDLLDLRRQLGLPEQPQAAA